MKYKVGDYVYYGDETEPSIILQVMDPDYYLILTPASLPKTKKPYFDIYATSRQLSLCGDLTLLEKIIYGF